MHPILNFFSSFFKLILFIFFFFYRIYHLYAIYIIKLKMIMNDGYVPAMQENVKFTFGLG